MNKDQIKDLIYLIIAIILGILAVKFIIWLLPVILVVIISYYLYRKMIIQRDIRMNKNNYTKKKEKSKKKEIKIIDMEEK